MTDVPELQAELERLRVENAALKARGSNGVSMRVAARAIDAGLSRPNLR